MSKQTDELIAKLTERFDEINTLYIRKVAAQIKKIGSLSQSSINRLTIMMEMTEDIAEITSALMQALSASRAEISAVYQQALDDVYTDQRFVRALIETPLSEAAKGRLTQYAQSVALQTQETFQNISNTTAVSETYRQTVDKSILAVSSGLGDYQSATRQTVRELGGGGIKVVYESGYKRRLDTAVRQNIIDGVNQIAQHGSDIMGEALGYDAVEITAHAMSAPDHEPVQGRVFLREEFEKMQSGQDCTDIDGVRFEGFRRPIGEWNCGHFAMSFSTKYSIRRYTPEQLDVLYKLNHGDYELNGKKITRYQASQMMRKIETDIRYEKEAGIAAQLVGDRVLQEECQRKINAKVTQYNAIVEASGLKAQRDRYQVNGYNYIKVA